MRRLCEQLVVTCLALVALASPAGQPPIHAESPAATSCKPSLPLGLQAQPSAPGRSDAWTLHLHSLDSDRDVVVWMWSSAGDRRVVWRGRLEREQVRRVDVAFAPASGADEVCVAMEPATDEGISMRAFTATPLRARTRTAAQKGHLIPGAGGGRGVLLYTGVKEESR
ncbi:MAG: hypothetical protein JSW67_00715 [Candidatus Latescibacterota bacterium]|nr:MAG: hypothetical protein JSW67_00715 [Candidatus Latescibacterota bacterium]